MFSIKVTYSQSSNYIRPMSILLSSRKNFNFLINLRSDSGGGGHRHGLEITVIKIKLLFLV
jgi:hypothetical protein